MKPSALTLTLSGLVFVMLGALISFQSSSTFAQRGEIGFGGGWGLGSLLGIFGALLALIGGSINRPKNYWLGAIVVGIIYVASFFGLFLEYEPRQFWGVISSLAPGMALIIHGAILSLFKRKS